MARSSYIYIVFFSGKLKAAFTVKHEMVTWLAKNMGDQDKHNTEIFRSRDGIYQEPPPENVTEDFFDFGK